MNSLYVDADRCGQLVILEKQLKQNQANGRVNLYRMQQAGQGSLFFYIISNFAYYLNVVICPLKDALEGSGVTVRL